MQGQQQMLFCLTGQHLLLPLHAICIPAVCTCWDAHLFADRTATWEKLTLDEVVRIIDNVSTEEDGAQQGEDGVLDWAWW